MTSYTITYNTNLNNTVVHPSTHSSDDNPVTLPYVYPKKVYITGFSTSTGYNRQYEYNASKNGWAITSGWTHVRLGRVVTSAQVTYFTGHTSHSPALNTLNGGIMGRWYFWGGGSLPVYWDPDSTTINDMTLLKFGARDTTVTIGGGLYQGSTTSTTSLYEDEGYVVSLSAVTGDLTVAVGFADGDTTGGDAADEEVAAEVVKAGVKYVTGDLTFNVGFASGDAQDNTIGGSGGNDDSKDVTSASVSYAVASGVTAILGYTDLQATDEGISTNDGSAWYIGANMAF